MSSFSKLSAIMLSVLVINVDMLLSLNVVIPSVIMLNVVAPLYDNKFGISTNISS